LKQQRLEYLAELYQKLKQELESRDLSKITTEKLIEIYFKTENRLLDEFGTIKHTTSETLPDEFTMTTFCLIKPLRPSIKLTLANKMKFTNLINSQRGKAATNTKFKV